MRFSKLFLACFCSVFLISAKAAFVVIGNPALAVNTITKHQLSDLYLDRGSNIPVKGTLYPLDHPSHTALYDEFYQNILGWNESQISGYWSQRVFSGQANPPQQVGDDAAAIAIVSRYPNYIAYVDPASIQNTSAVKILYAAGQINQAQRPITQIVRQPDHPPIVPPLPKRSAHTQALLAQKLAAIQHLQLARQKPTLAVTHMVSENSDDTSSQADNLWKAIIDRFQLSDDYDRPEVKAKIKEILEHKKGLEIDLEHAKPYLFYIYRQTKRFGLPGEYALLPMVESGYNPFALSRVGAAGLWQMMPITANVSGLDVNWWYDGRKDILTSTQAALYHLALLHRRFTDWLLVTAAYNIGGGAIDKRVKENKKKNLPADFWDLKLPKETKNYVPKLLAYAAIVKNADKYGITLPSIPNKPYFLTITLDSQIDLGEVANLSGASLETIHQLNPGLQRWATNPSGSYHLLLPIKKGVDFNKAIEKAINEQHTGWKYHKMKQGETLAQLAKLYKTDVDYLKKVNDLKTDKIAPGKGIIVPVYLHEALQEPVKVQDVINESVLLPHHLEGPPVPEKPKTLLEEKPKEPTVTEPKKPVSVTEHHREKATESLKEIMKRIYGSSL